MVKHLTKKEMTRHDEEDGVRLWIFHLFAFFLFPNMIKNVFPTLLLHYIEDLECILQFTLTHIKNFSKKVFEREVEGGMVKSLLTSCKVVLTIKNRIHF